MKSQILPVKRRPVPQGVFRRLSAVTRKQRAAAVPATELDDDDGSSKISRALTIIFLIHIVAIGLIFFHQRFLDDRPAEQTATPKAVSKASAARVAPREGQPLLKPGDKAYFVQQGDNYARIAAAHGVDESELRQINSNVEIDSGRLLIIPPKRIVAENPPEVVAIREQSLPDVDEGLVPAVDFSNAPKARLVRPKTSGIPVVASGQFYTVQSGDSVWRIANRFSVSQDALMHANGITDARKMRAGMKLVIPQP